MATRNKTLTAQDITRLLNNERLIVTRRAILRSNFYPGGESLGVTLMHAIATSPNLQKNCRNPARIFEDALALSRPLN